MTKHDELAAAPFILWVDYGFEGWRPLPFEHEADLVTVLLTGATLERLFVITGPTLKGEFAVPDAQEASDAAD